MRVVLGCEYGNQQDEETRAVEARWWERETSRRLRRVSRLSDGLSSRLLGRH